MKKRRISRAAPLILVLVIALMLGFDLSMRRGTPTLDAEVEDIHLEDGRFSMTAGQGGNSGTSFRRFRYDIQDDALYLTLYSGLVYGSFRGDSLDITIRDEGLCEVRRVYLRDGFNTKLIYLK